MSAQAGAPELEESSDFIVFDGSSPADVSHARKLWSSVSLLPPLESRLQSADIRQRLPVSRPQRDCTVAGPTPKRSSPEPHGVLQRRREEEEEERRRYVAVADRRREILALLRRQREQRIHEELVSMAFKPKVKVGKDKKRRNLSDGDEELVKELQ